MIVETLSLAGQPLPQFAAAPRAVHGPSPLRRPGSVRRTASIDVVWPEGRTGASVLDGHARDILTPVAGGAPMILAEDRMHVRADRRVILEVTSDPPRAALAKLAGARAGGHLRSAIDEALPAERRTGTPLYLLLDDLAGATLVAGWGLSRWDDAGPPVPTPELLEFRARMEGICVGFRSGSSALSNDFSRDRQNATAVVPLPHPDDPAGWHPLPDPGSGPHFRRARRIDVWREDGAVRIDSTFQDSARTPDGSRLAIHEYRLHAIADADARALTAIEAVPGTLPFRECPAAPTNLAALVGTPLAELRTTVLELLRKTAGCTHLNDMVRALAEVPRLVAGLPG